MAGEGSFFLTRRLPEPVSGPPRLRFGFQVTMAARDLALLRALQAFLGCGSICHRSAKNHWQPTSTFTVAGNKTHHRVTIPFAEAFLLPCAKKDQFEAWRAQLLAYETENPLRQKRERSTCAIAGCDKPVRGRGLCRSHYYRETGY